MKKLFEVQMQLLLLVAVLAAAPCCTMVCQAASSRTAPPPRCDPLALLPCVPAFILGAAPSGECCATLREQLKPCLCSRYSSKNPELRGYIASPDGKRIARGCRVRVRGFRC